MVGFSLNHWIIRTLWGVMLAPLLGFCQLAAAAQPTASLAPQTINMDEDHYSLSPAQLWYLVDERGDRLLADIITPGKVTWTAASQEATGVTRHADVWMYFKIENRVFDQIVIENNWNITLSHAALYWRSSSGLTALPPQRLHASMFSLPLPPGKHEFYLKLENINARTFKPSIQISNFHYLTTHSQGKSALITLIFGVTIAMIIINFGLLLFYKKLYFFYYIIYSASMGGILGIGSFYIPNRPSGLWLTFHLVYGVSTFLFVNSSLSLRKHAVGIAGVMAATCATLVLAIAADFLFDIDSHFYIFQLVLSALALSAAFVRSVQGYRPAIFFAVGWTALSLGYAINAIGMIFHLPSPLMYSAYVGFAIELILFAFAVGYKAWLSERKVLSENIHAFKQLNKVFFAHQISQIKTGVELEQTMPTGPGEACVICFDIIGSTKIQHEKTKEFLQKVFHRCYELMHEGYDEITMHANAYRIKEMGDGFICSVGYPFKSPTGYMARDALALSYRFLDVFHEEVAKFRYHSPIHCCIALAMDHISGFFPESGTKSYDLFGRAVILATRYEAMRKLLFPAKLEHSVIILHERVFASLDLDQHPRFIRYQLKQNNTIVRDDPSAEHLFYQKIEMIDQEKQYKIHIVA